MVEHFPDVFRKALSLDRAFCFFKNNRASIVCNPFYIIFVKPFNTNIYCDDRQDL